MKFLKKFPVKHFKSIHFKKEKAKSYKKVETFGYENGSVCVVFLGFILNFSVQKSSLNYNINLYQKYCLNKLVKLS